MNLNRRVFLECAGAVAIVWLAALAPASAEQLPPLPEGAFTYVVIPDTQRYSGEGALVGAATVNGDLTVTSEGGAYGASLAVTGRLTLVGTPTIWTGFAGGSVSLTAFTFGSTDAASRAAFEAAACAEGESLGRRWAFSARASDTLMKWSISPGGTYLYFR